MITYGALTKLLELKKKGKPLPPEALDWCDEYIWVRSQIASIDEQRIRQAEKDLRETKRYITKALKIRGKLDESTK